jgi:ABC-2 type transport system ATP-binding protein
MVKNIIETFDLSKTYKLKGRNKEIKALNRISININENEIFGLLGPNGAGKTTLIKILTTLIQPTEGYAIIDGVDVVKSPKKVKPLIGLMLGGDMLYYRLTGYDNLKFFCKIYKVTNYQKKIYDIAKEFGLERWLNQYVGLFSSGMKLKLALCRTLLLERKILFLDEPALGLDVQSIAFIVKKLKSLRKTIFLTSHNMSVVEKLCDKIAFIDKGDILKIGDKTSIKTLAKLEIKVKIEIIDGKEKLRSELMNQEYVNDVLDDNRGLLIFLRNKNDYSSLFSILTKYKVLKIKEEELTLEDLFLKLI